MSATSDPVSEPIEPAEAPTNTDFTDATNLTDVTGPTDTTAALGAFRVALRRRRRFVTVTPEGSRIIRL